MRWRASGNDQTAESSSTQGACANPTRRTEPTLFLFPTNLPFCPTLTHAAFPLFLMLSLSPSICFSLRLLVFLTPWPVHRQFKAQIHKYCMVQTPTSSWTHMHSTVQAAGFIVFALVYFFMGLSDRFDRCA